MQRLTLVFVTLLSLVALGQSLCEFRQNSGNSTTCAVVNVTISLEYTYTDNEKSEKTSGSRAITCPSDFIKADNCNSPVLMTFNLTEDDMLITFQFKKESNNEWDLSNISMVINAEEFFNSTFYGPDSITIYTDKSIVDKVGQKKSYMCSASKSYTLKSSSSNVTMTMKLSDLRAQAFDFDKNGDDPEFGSATRCNDDIKGSKIVPIAVGAALAGLVIIVLIAYIIGRIRSRKQSSYEALS